MPRRRCPVAFRFSPTGSGTDQLMPRRVAKDGYLPDSLLVLGGSDERVSVQLVRTR